MYGHLAVPLAASSGGQTLLERITILDATRESYRDRNLIFQEFLTANRMIPRSPANTLICFLDFIDVIFLEGGSHEDGGKSLAALQELIPRIADETVLLKRIRRGLKGWAKRIGIYFIDLSRGL